MARIYCSIRDRIPGRTEYVPIHNSLSALSVPRFPDDLKISCNQGLICMNHSILRKVFFNIPFGLTHQRLIS